MKGFIKISKYAGMREDLVQGGGGNSSCKISDQKMAIKASGFQLADLTEKEGYALVDPQVIKKEFSGVGIFEDLSEEQGRLLLQKAQIEGPKPSIETFLHAVSGKYTLHTHPIVVNALTCRKEGMEVLGALFPQALLVPYATPGVELAKAYFRAYRKKDDKILIPEIVFLQNHGLVVSAASADAVIEKNEDVLTKIEQYLNIDFGHYHAVTKIWKLFEDKIVWLVTDKNVMDFYRKSYRMWEHTFCPDCIVFLGKKCLRLPEVPTKKDVNEFCVSYGCPVMVSYGENLYIVADSVKKALEIQSVMSFSAQVMQINQGCECVLLTEEEQNFLLNWEAEKYRKTMN